MVVGDVDVDVIVADIAWRLSFGLGDLDKITGTPLRGVYALAGASPRARLLTSVAGGGSLG